MDLQTCFIMLRWLYVEFVSWIRERRFAWIHRGSDVHNTVGVSQVASGLVVVWPGAVSVLTTRVGSFRALSCDKLTCVLNSIQNQRAILK